MCVGVRTLEMRAFEVFVVSRDPDPGKGVDDSLRPFRTVARFVGVLDPQHERTTEPTCERPVVEGSACTAHVERTGG